MLYYIVDRNDTDILNWRVYHTLRELREGEGIKDRMMLKQLERYLKKNTPHLKIYSYPSVSEMIMGYLPYGYCVFCTFSFHHSLSTRSLCNLYSCTCPTYSCELRRLAFKRNNAAITIQKAWNECSGNPRYRLARKIAIDLRTSYRAAIQEFFKDL